MHTSFNSGDTRVGRSKHGPVRPMLSSCASTLVHLNLLPSISAIGGSVPPRTKVGVLLPQGHINILSLHIMYILQEEASSGDAS